MQFHNAITLLDGNQRPLRFGMPRLPTPLPLRFRLRRRGLGMKGCCVLGGSELFCGVCFRAFNSASSFASNSRMMTCASAGWRAISSSVTSSSDIPDLSLKSAPLTRSIPQPDNPRPVNGYRRDSPISFEIWNDEAYDRNPKCWLFDYRPAIVLLTLLSAYLILWSPRRPIVITRAVLT